MQIDYPISAQIPELKALWQIAFGDSSEDIELFFALGFSPNRCRCICIDDIVVAALYWFDTRLEGQHFAYLYAVATHPDFRNRGLCRALLTDTLALLKSLGFSGAILKPETDSLAAMYASMGFEPGTRIWAFSASAGNHPLPIREITPEEYAAKRQCLLPQGGIIQDGADFALVAAQGQFYAGEDFLLAAAKEDHSLQGLELLGNPQAAPDILAALDIPVGTFRTPGDEQPFTMVYPLTADCKKPSYFGFVLD